MRFRLVYILLVVLAIHCFPQRERIILSPGYREKSLPFGLTEKIPAARPVIGLALSGGGARGISQVGVLRALLEQGIKPEIVVGTSMGSIVGAMYAAGYGIDDMDSIAINTDWNDLLSVNRKINRRELFIDQKLTEDKSVLTLRLRGLIPILPTSVNDGQKLTNYLNLLTFQAPIRIKNNFDELEARFRAVSTNLTTGEPYVMKSGSLTQAVRASSSVSFLLTPVYMDSVILVDGGLVANVPVKITKEEGAEFVIAINTTSPLYSRDELELPWLVADQLLSIPMKLINERQIADADFLIEPNVGKITSAAFTSADSLITLGYINSKPYAEKLKIRLDSILNKRICRNERYLSHYVISEARSVGVSFLRKFAGRDSVAYSEIMHTLYEINQEGEFDSIFAVIEKVNGQNELYFDGIRAPLIKSVSVQGINILSIDTVANTLNKLTGKPFVGQNVLNTVKELLGIYRSSGYSLAELDSINYDKSTGELELHIKEGIISEIVLKGVEQTNPTIILRELPFSEGDIYRNDALQQGLTNLRSTNLFESIIVSVEKFNGRNRLVLDVDEKVSSLIRLGFKLDNENPSQFQIDVRDENIFGSATELGFVSYLSARAIALLLEHKANRVFDSYFTYNINGYYKFNDIYSYADVPQTSRSVFSRATNGEYRQIFYGASLSLGTQVARFGNVIIKTKYEKSQVKDLSNLVVNPFLLSSFSVRISSNIDTQDKYPYPDRGIKFYGYYETASKVLGTDLGFTMFGVEWKAHVPVTARHNVAARAKVGFADPTLPLTYQYSLGGQSSFFGLREDEYRGRQIFLTSAEYRYFLPFKIFFDTYFQVRYDLGSTWEVENQIRFKDLRHGVGTTLSFNTPVGPADFSIGRSFYLIDNLPGSPFSFGPIYFYFSIGYYY